MFAADGDDGMLEMAMAEAEAVASAPASGGFAVQAPNPWVNARRGRVPGQHDYDDQVVGSHSYYFVDDTWTRDDYEAGTDAPVVEVGSDEFLELIARGPSLADAAALGERVVTEGPDGCITSPGRTSAAGPEPAAHRMRRGPSRAPALLRY